jgi:hypothetical protein
MRNRWRRARRRRYLSQRDPSKWLVRIAIALAVVLIVALIDKCL